MIHHEDIQTRLNDLIETVIGRDRLPTINDKQNMDLMEATILEVLRYMSHVPLCLPHFTTGDTSICEYFIPKDTKVWATSTALYIAEPLLGILLKLNTKWWNVLTNRSLVNCLNTFNSFISFNTFYGTYSTHLTSFDQFIDIIDVVLISIIDTKHVSDAG